MTVTGAARRAYQSLPVAVQRRVQGGVERVRGRKLQQERDGFLKGVAAAVDGFEGKRVLEIGADPSGALLRDIDVRHHAAEAIGLDPEVPSRAIGPHSRIEQVDARSTGFTDESFDVVYSTSAFEHVHGLGEVLAECHRILRPGGLLYSHFGPIWSTSYGHHLWIDHGPRALTYHNVLLPPWCHLLRSRGELEALCEPDHGIEAARRIVEFIFESPEQNRLFFDDYERIVGDSALETMFLKGYDAPALAAKYPEAQRPALHDELRERYPDRHGFLYDGIVLLLRKGAG